MISEEIERLIQLRNSGALTEEEFQQAKQRVLNGSSASEPLFVPPPQGSMGPASATIFGMEPRIWLSLMHASQLLTWTGIGIVAPIVMWIVSREESQEANRHGLVIINWMLSSLVYLLISFLACLIVIGVPMLIVLAALNIVFPIIGALQASNGTLWRYPLTINFFDPNATR